MSTEKSPEPADPISAPTTPVSHTPQTPPDLPPKNAPPLPPRDGKPNFKPIYNMKSLTATILTFRQSELYGSPGMNMYGDIFASTPVEMESRLATSVSDSPEWASIIRDYSDEYIRTNRVHEIEQLVLKGIPASARPLVYLKTMRVRSHIENVSYHSVVKRAKSAQWENACAVESSLPEDVAELLQVYEYCVKEVNSAAQEPDVTTKKFVNGVLPFLVNLPGLGKPEVLALVFKFGALVNRASKDEFYYKCSRAVEDADGDVLLHISKQGVDISEFYKGILLDLFSSGVEQEVLLCILDLIVFEGIDFFVRLIAALFSEHSAKILEAKDDELSNYIFSDKFLLSASHETICKATDTEISLIKYENEFQLMSANAISGNDNELSNLKDANEDLMLRISDIRKRIENLKKTQTEILSQSEEYTQRLVAAQKEKKDLSDLAQELQAKYAHLTMKENLNNTIQANKEISSENADLEAQIEEITKKVEGKKQKLEKISNA